MAEDYIELFKSGRLNILSVAPEGEYSLWGNGVDIQPFRWVDVVQVAFSQSGRMSSSLQRQTRIFAAAATAAFIATIQEWFEAGCTTDLNLEGQQTLDMLEQGLSRSIPQLTGSEA